MAKGQSIAGRKNNDGIDYYETPVWAVEKLLEKEVFSEFILEPCCGGGAIAKTLEDYGHNVLSTDIRTDDGIYGLPGVDFFAAEFNPIANIITNPPYFCADEFVKLSLDIATDKVAMLLKLSFLESMKRYPLFKNSPLRTVYVFSSRVTMFPANQVKPINSGTIAYAWFVWEQGYIGKPEIDWLI